MGVIEFIFAILLVNPVTSVNKLPSERPLNVLSDLPATVFTLQIRQIRTEAQPSVPTGNNLFVAGRSVSAQDVEKNFKPISTVYPITSKIERNSETIFRIANEEKNKLFSSSIGNIEGNQEEYIEKPLSQNGNNINAFRSTWNDCNDLIFEENTIAKNNHSDLDNPSFRIHKKDEILWHKRDIEPKVTNDINLSQDKPNNIESIKYERRRQQKPDLVLPKKNTSVPSISTENILSTIQIIPITRELFKDTELSDTTQNIIATENNEIESHTEDWFVTKELTKIRFHRLPQRETYLIPTLKLSSGFYPFSFMSEIFYVIYPFDFPVGLIKDIIWGEFNFPYSFLQSIKVESTFLAFIILFACIALVIPSYLLILAVLSLFAKSSGADDLETGVLFPAEKHSNCHDKVLVAMTVIALLFCCAFITVMEVSNEQAHNVASLSRNVVRCACSDIATWLSSAARELHHSLIPPMDLVLYAYKDDLKNAEILLGQPIQQAISSESGINLVFDSLADIIAECEDISNKISSLRDVGIKASGLAAAASERIKDLGQQIENVKKNCILKDMPLCETINTNSLELWLKFDMILHEQRLLELRALGVDNLTLAVSTARKEFRSLPSVISAQTAQVRGDILTYIEQRRQEVHYSGKIFNEIVRHLTGNLHSVARDLETTLDRIQRYEFWRWTIMLACIVAFSFVMLLIFMGLVCGCGNGKNHAKMTLKVSAVFLCFTSLILWSIISIIFLISGHAEIYLCHALKDSPQYETLTALFDRPSPFLSNNEGIFDVIFREMENITIDVSVKDVIRNCEIDRPAYTVFQLDRIIDINKETSYFEWEEFQADLGRLTSAIDVAVLKTLPRNFSKLLNKILIVSDVNLPKYREDYYIPVVRRDLPSLADQLEHVSVQVSDLTNAGRFETLAKRTQKLYYTNIKPLEQLRAEMVYKITELELKLSPFRRKLNISLSQIHTAQYYIDHQGNVIAQKKVSTFISRLISHAAGWRTHVLTSIGKHAAKCGPLFTIYDNLRSLLCDQYITSLHGWWTCGFFLGVIWCSALTPLCVKLWRAYSNNIIAHDAMMLATLNGQQETPTTAMCDSSNWNTPGPPPPPRSDSW